MQLKHIDCDLKYIVFKPSQVKVKTVNHIQRNKRMDSYRVFGMKKILLFALIFNRSVVSLLCYIMGLKILKLLLFKLQSNNCCSRMH